MSDPEIFHLSFDIGVFKFEVQLGNGSSLRRSAMFIATNIPPNTLSSVRSEIRFQRLARHVVALLRSASLIA